MTCDHDDCFLLKASFKNYANRNDYYKLWKFYFTGFMVAAYFVYLQ